MSRSRSAPGTISISSQHSKTAGAWNEFDWFAGVTATVGDFKLGAQFVEFDSPPGNFHAEQNVELSASYADHFFGPVKINPYVKMFNAVSGNSTVVLGKKGGTFDVEIGAAPSIPVAPVVISFPTWVTVGPSNFWGGGGNVGVFSIGGKVTLPLSFIPAKFGGWYIDAGVQFYDFINHQLQDAAFILGNGSGPVKNATVGSVGFGFGF